MSRLSFFALFILDTRERVYVFAHADLVMRTVFFQLSFDILLDHSLVTPYRCNLSLWTLSVKRQERALVKRMSQSNPYALSLFIGIIELIAQNRSDIDFIDNIYHAIFARMLRMPAYYYTV